MKKLMLTFLGANGLFLASAGILLGFCIVSEQQERASKNVDNVAFDVLLTECPLRGMHTSTIQPFLPVLIQEYSWHRQCRLHVHHFPAVATSTCTPHEPWLAQITRLHDSLLRLLHPHPRSRNLVRHPSNRQEPLPRLGYPIHRHPVPATTALPMLRLHRQPDTTVHCRQCVHRLIHCEPEARMRGPILCVRQHVP